MYECKVSVITVMYECYLSLDLRTSSTFSGTRAHIHSSLLLISLKDTTGCYCGVLRFCEQLWDMLGCQVVTAFIPQIKNSCQHKAELLENQNVSVLGVMGCYLLKIIM